LCKEHFPGLVEFTGKTEPAYTFDHYAITDDARDLVGKQFPNKAEWVKAELWVSLPHTTLLNTSHSLDILEILNGYIASICQARFEDRAALVATKECKKLVKEAHVQAVITYNAVFLGTKVTKADARKMTLTKEQYLEVNIVEH
jgi:hypothetical protein